MIEQHSSTCQLICTTHELTTLKTAMLDGARRHHKSRDDQLSGKFEKISPTKQPSSDGVLAHNLSSHRLTQQQLAVLAYDAKFNMIEAQPEDFIVSCESALQNFDAEQSAVVYSIPYQDCDERYFGEMGKRLGTWLHEHQLAINCKDKLSLVYVHAQQLNHDFTFEKTRVLGRANEKMVRLVLESWSSTGTLQAYQALRRRLGSVWPGPIRQTSMWNREPMLTEKRGRGRRSHDQSQTLPHQCARKTENNSREQQRLISLLIPVGRPTDTLPCSKGDSGHGRPPALNLGEV
ncbi:unnamed protein product [Schistocephalus solidus]|uniref:Uncharacterized protein n=1 Tax=Schistocephalus solidus TaxID=70667 RepID=A0A183TN77_SCHSO|nr:unnamed protein product [Schistocephalus solidus]